MITKFAIVALFIATILQSISIYGLTKDNQQMKWDINSLTQAVSYLYFAPSFEAEEEDHE